MRLTRNEQVHRRQGLTLQLDSNPSGQFAELCHHEVQASGSIRERRMSPIAIKPGNSPHLKLSLVPRVKHLVSHALEHRKRSRLHGIDVVYIKIVLIKKVMPNVLQAGEVRQLNDELPARGQQFVMLAQEIVKRDTTKMLDQATGADHIEAHSGRKLQNIFAIERSLFPNIKHGLEVAL